MTTAASLASVARASKTSCPGPRQIRDSAHGTEAVSRTSGTSSRFGHGTVVRANPVIAHQGEGEDRKRRSDTRLAVDDDFFVFGDPGPRENGLQLGWWLEDGLLVVRQELLAEDVDRPRDVPCARVLERVGRAGPLIRRRFVRRS
jgi:hypothetical protein